MMEDRKLKQRERRSQYLLGLVMFVFFALGALSAIYGIVVLCLVLRGIVASDAVGGGGRLGLGGGAPGGRDGLGRGRYELRRENARGKQNRDGKRMLKWKGCTLKSCIA